MAKINTPEHEFRSLGANARVIRALEVQGIVSLKDLAQVTERQAARWPGIGPKALQVLRGHMRPEINTSVVPSGPCFVSLKFEVADLVEIDQWGEARGLLSRAHAIRELVQRGLLYRGRRQ